MYVVCIMYLCVCVYVAKKLILPFEKSSASVTCSLVEFNCQKRCLLCQAICSGEEIQKHSINGMGESQLRVPKYCIMVSHTLNEVFNEAMQCKQMQNAHCGMPTGNCSEFRPTGNSVLTVLSTHTVCVLWNSSFWKKSFQKVFFC